MQTVQFVLLFSIKNVDRANHSMTTSETIIQIKLHEYINDRCKNIVFGYIKKMETKLGLYQNIPPLIIHLCVMFYFPGEYIEKCTQDLAISNNNMTITKIDKDFAWNNKAFGKIWIDSTSNSISKWVIKINSIKDFLNPSWAHIFVGIVSNDQDTNATFCSDGNDVSDSPLYLFRANGQHHCIENYNQYKEKILNEKFGTNDQILLTLNMIERKIFLKINQRKQKCIFENIVKQKGIRYKLAFSLFSVGNQITLTDFDSIHY